MLNNKNSSKRVRNERKMSVPLRRPPRLKGEVAKIGIKPIRKKSKKK